MPGDYVRLRVKDTGHGMPEEVQARIFEPFFTTKSPSSNSGLGLPTVYGIVRQFDGYIAVESAPGQGATFDVHLPRCAEQPAAPTPNAKQPAVRGGTETILLVEDQPDVRRVEARILRQLGYDVIEAASGEEALGLAETSGQRIRLLFTDVVMPGMDGPALADKLRAMYPDMKVILTSGYTEERVARLGVPKTRTSFVQKPFCRQDVAARVRQLLDAPPDTP
jgi:CheY-like chemotaxis protein